VHSVLSQKQSAAQAASDLQRQLLTMLKAPGTSNANTLRSDAAVAAR